MSDTWWIIILAAVSVVVACCACACAITGAIVWRATQKLERVQTAVRAAITSSQRMDALEQRMDDLRDFWKRTASRQARRKVLDEESAAAAPDEIPAQHKHLFGVE